MPRSLGARAARLAAALPSLGLIAAGLVLLAFLASDLGPEPARAQGTQWEPRRLTGSHAAQPREGLYLAGDALRFAVDREGNRVRLRFVGEDEDFYLTIAPGQLGGRVLKYDTGETALKVAGWGEVTVYTREAPGGIPASLIGDPPAAHAGVPSPQKLKALAADIGQRLQYVGGITLNFDADWSELGNDANAARLVLDTLQNSARAFEILARSPEKRKAIAARFDTVRVAPDRRMIARIKDRTLTITYMPSEGAAGRPSSHAIAIALSDLL